jgi:hypothetical protein
MGYVIIRRSDGKYVSKPGSAKSYTQYLQNARVFPTKEAAERERCPENETIITR